MQKASGESTGDALIKTGAHVAIGAIGMAIGGPLGFGAAVLGSMVFDKIYDNYKDDVIDVGKNAVNAVSAKWVMPYQVLAKRWEVSLVDEENNVIINYHLFY